MHSGNKMVSRHKFSANKTGVRKIPARNVPISTQFHSDFIVHILYESVQSYASWHGLLYSTVACNNMYTFHNYQNDATAFFIEMSGWDEIMLESTSAVFNFENNFQRHKSITNGVLYIQINGN